MPRRTPKPKRRSSEASGGFCSTPAQRAAQARIEAEADRGNRTLSNAFMFWRDCATARCRRMQACAGAPDCFASKWRQLSPDIRFMVRETALARQQGADPWRAVEIARQKLGESDALAARFDSASAERDRQPSSNVTPPSPRLRRL